MHRAVAKLESALIEAKALASDVDFRHAFGYLWGEVQYFLQKPEVIALAAIAAGKKTEGEDILDRMDNQNA